MSLVLDLDVPDEVILGRISDRWVHLPSGRVYNLSYNPPKVAGHDDETGEPLTKRPDDNPVRKFVSSASFSTTLNVIAPRHVGDLRSPSGTVLRFDLAASCVLQRADRE